MSGHRSEPKGWQGFSTIKDEEALPPKPIGSPISRILVPILTLLFAAGIGALAGVAVYFMIGYMLKFLAFSFISLSLFVIFGMACSLSVWARAYYKEKQTRHVAEHYKDARPPYKRPETERERVWRERQIERELGTGAEAEREGDGGENGRSL